MDCSTANGLRPCHSPLTSTWPQFCIMKSFDWAMSHFGAIFSSPSGKYVEDLATQVCTVPCDTTKPNLIDDYVAYVLSVYLFVRLSDYRNKICNRACRSVLPSFLRGWTSEEVMLSNVSQDRRPCWNLHVGNALIGWIPYSIAVGEYSTGTQLSRVLSAPLENMWQPGHCPWFVRLYGWILTWDRWV